MLTSLTCSSPPSFPSHMATTLHCASSFPVISPPEITVPNFIFMSPVSQWRRMFTGFRLDMFTARLVDALIRIQLSVRCFSRWATVVASSPANFTGVGTVSDMPRRSIRNGEERNQPELFLAVEDIDGGDELRRRRSAAALLSLAVVMNGGESVGEERAVAGGEAGDDVADDRIGG
nr:hypothetical protein KK1_022341 [Ipomoea batatas]